MKSKKAFWFLALGLVVLIAGASLLYNHLSDNMERENLATTQDPPTQTETDEEATVDTTKPDEEESDSEESVQPSLAPDFTVVDGEGNEVHLSDFIGKPVVVNFWASWCEPCKSEMADFNEACAEYSEQVEFMMINCTDGSRETLDTAKAYIAEQGFTFPVYYDTTYSAAIAYGASSIPMSFFIDAEGYAIAYGMGAMSRDTLQTGLDMILPQK